MILSVLLVACTDLSNRPGITDGGTPICKQFCSNELDCGAIASVSELNTCIDTCSTIAAGSCGTEFQAMLACLNAVRGCPGFSAILRPSTDAGVCSALDDVRGSKQPDGGQNSQLCCRNLETFVGCAGAPRDASRALDGSTDARDASVDLLLEAIPRDANGASDASTDARDMPIDSPPEGTPRDANDALDASINARDASDDLSVDAMSAADARDGNDR